MKQQGHNILMKMVQQTQKQTKLLQIANFMPKILLADDVAEGTNSLKSNQREVFNVIHT